MSEKKASPKTLLDLLDHIYEDLINRNVQSSEGDTLVVTFQDVKDAMEPLYKKVEGLVAELQKHRDKLQSNIDNQVGNFNRNYGEWFAYEEVLVLLGGGEK